MFEFVVKNFGQIVLAVSAVTVIFFLIKNFAKIKKFVNEVVVELGKVSWSTREELLTATWVVIFSTALMAVFIFVADSALSKLLGLLIKR